MAIGPMVFSSILGADSSAETANTMLYACGAVSFSAAFLYAPHYSTIPKARRPSDTPPAGHSVDMSMYIIATGEGGAGGAQ